MITGRMGLLAEAASVGEGGKITAMNIFTNLNAPSWPAGMVVMHLIVWMDVPDEDAGHSVQVNVNVLNESDEAVYTSTGAATILKPGPNHALNIQMPGVGLPGPGSYRVRLLINNAPVYDVPFTATQVAAEGVAGAAG